MRYLIVYDICNTKRLQKIHRCLLNRALPLQKSVFLFVGSKSQFNILWDELANKMNKHSDDIRAYVLGDNSIEWSQESNMKDMVLLL